MTKVIREAVKYYKNMNMLESQRKLSINKILLETAGIWKNVDGLKYQKEIREEWK